MEFDFVIAPGADSRAIKLSFDGGGKPRIDAHGDLVLATASGELRLHRPIAYQETDGVRQAVPVRFALQNRRQVGFQMAAYDRTKPLIIDPVLAYATYLGGNKDEANHGIAVDRTGNVYVVGETFSSDFPTSSGALQTALAGLSDAFVAKLDPTGSFVVYSTYLGGSDRELGMKIAADRAGHAYVTGYTSSGDFPTTPGAVQPTYGGGNGDAFVTKLDATGSVVYSTYLGASGAEFGRSIAVDRAGNAYVSGDVLSADFPTTPGAFQTTYGGGPSDTFVTKLDSTGSALVYSTFLGGSDRELGGVTVVVDRAGSAYVTGYTASSDFPTTPQAFQSTHAGGVTDAFVTKLDPTGSRLVYSTYLGGSAFEIGSSLAVDRAGNAYVTGQVASGDFPTTPAAFQTTHGGGITDGFAAKLNRTGSALLYSTYLGGIDLDYARAVQVDRAGNAYVAGQTRSADFPTTAGAFQTTLNGIADATFAKLDRHGSRLLYSTFLGGSDNDYAIGIALGRHRDIYLTGGTASSDFPTTPEAFQTTSGGDFDAFVVKLVEEKAKRKGEDKDKNKGDEEEDDEEDEEDDDHSQRDR